MDNLRKIADDIIGYADGAYHLDMGEEYEELSPGEQILVNEMVFAEIASCNCCGWHFHVDSLEFHENTGETVCWRCYKDLDEESE